MPRRLIWADVERRLVPAEGGHRLWTGYVERRTGYGAVTYQQQRVRVHVLVWEHHNGPVAADKSVLHRVECHVRTCGEISHLYIGTHEQNMLDMVANDTTLRGDRNWSAKITWEQARLIRVLRAQGASQSQLAVRFGCNPSTISDVVRGVSWKERGDICIACHYKGDNVLPSIDKRVKDHGDGDWRCIRLGRCVDCGQDPEQDVQLVSGHLEHLCARIVAMQVIGSHFPRYADGLQAG